jgi:hypothetical protein
MSASAAYSFLSDLVDRYRRISSHDKEFSTGIDVVALLSSTNCIFDSFQEASSAATKNSQHTLSDKDFASKYFDSLSELHEKHLRDLLDWEREGCLVYEGVSA